MHGRFLVTRRKALLAPFLAAVTGRRIIDTHVHLFSADTKSFPFSKAAPYQPAPLTVEDYAGFAPAAGIEHAVIVHPEPYQDDHRYLEYCFAKEPSKGYFKGTCLFDPVRPETPSRMKELMRRNPNRIVALRIHEMHAPGTPPSSTGPIKDRDLQSDAMRSTWRAVADLGLRIQFHFLPYYAEPFGKLAAQFPQTPVILDHLGRGWQGTPEQFNHVLALAKQKQVYIKIAEIPDAKAKPLIRRAYDAFGPDRILWGDFGHDQATVEKQMKFFESLCDFASADAMERMRYGNARKLFGF